MLHPVCTYRLQFHKDFTFDHLKKIIPYLHSLGVSTIYAAPILKATPSSAHGYDGVDPHMINPEIGTEEKLAELNKELKSRGMSWLQDIVPNHMAFHPDNTWLMDVLEKGGRSFYYTFFDIDWNSPVYKGKVMAPFLGASLEEVIKKRELKIDFKNNRFVFSYYDHHFPLSPLSYTTLLANYDGTHGESLQKLIGQIHQVQKVEDNTAYSLEWKEILMQLTSLLKLDNMADWLKGMLAGVNSNPKQLKSISDQQVYRLCYWQETDQQINYRRFFTINGLICLNIQDPVVCTHYHQYIASLVKKGIINGLRIDHIDGLYDPAAYLEHLRDLTEQDLYVVAEKILEPGENFPSGWAAQGSTGYDFLSLVNNLLTNKAGEEPFSEFYRKISKDDTSIHQQIHDKKAYILYKHMGGELENLATLFAASGLVPKKDVKALKSGVLKKSIAEVLIQCPVYRFYGNLFPLGEEEKESLQDIFHRICEHKPELSDGIQMLEKALLIHPEQHDENYNIRASRFYQRLMQFTGPLMAKGVEDTLMYTYNRYLGNNEVGDSPETFGITVRQFHKAMKKRREEWPLSINATSTHDTKRGEDANARLNVLTDLPEEWIEAVKEWQKINKGLKENNLPDENDEYLIYQGLVATFPFHEDPAYTERFQDYIVKALREGKRHSNWTEPNEAYEEAAGKFVSNLLDRQNPFWKSFQDFHSRVADLGIVNSLTKVILKLTCPGVPDIYQGCERWDLSMVDPDNRRPVDFEDRIEWLDKLSSGNKIRQEEIHALLWDTRSDANIKLWLIHRLLKERNLHKDLFLEGMYIPLKVKGKYKEHICAFARKHKETWFIAAVPLHPGALWKKTGKEITEMDWSSTRIILPAQSPDDWEQLLDRSKGKTKGELYIQDLFSKLPFALVKLENPGTERSAGILMHITSLPSPFGVGDFGPEARTFADFLERSGQKYWQLLPLNITEAGNAHSPYSSISGMAGNTLLISPEILSDEGLLDRDELKELHLPSRSVADFREAEKIKAQLFEKAYQAFVSSGGNSKAGDFRQFLQRESFWLDDFALYVQLKRVYQGKAWYQWPEKYKLREEKALQSFSDENTQDLRKIKWLQFVFSNQWQSLKKYCNSLGIQMFGDLPFYVSYDSADVWSNPDIFSLDNDGKLIGVAGVPPDYFNSDGQLWGMPVFRWDVLKKRNYDWWIRRIKKNLELYDVLRLDHFRAFADYWEVAANETTAKNGAWKPGPGADFFKVLQHELGELPFIAEDLGDINEEVHRLRDDFKLPGMKVLQFAFGEDMPQSIYIPHNYNPNFIAYTGTHDNNTTVGWFRENTGKTERKNIARYTGIKPKEKNIHRLLARLAYGSIAKTVILPLQDVLGLNEQARMNIPASMDKNWIWRLKPGQLGEGEERLLRKWVKTYNR